MAYSPGFTPDHRSSVAESWEAAAGRRTTQADELEQAGDTEGAAQCRTWATACRATATDVRSNPR